MARSQAFLNLWLSPHLQQSVECSLLYGPPRAGPGLLTSTVFSRTPSSLPDSIHANHVELTAFSQTLRAFVLAWKALLYEVFVDHPNEKWLILFVCPPYKPNILHLADAAGALPTSPWKRCLLWRGRHRRMLAMNTCRSTWGSILAHQRTFGQVLRSSARELMPLQTAFKHWWRGIWWLTAPAVWPLDWENETHLHRLLEFPRETEPWLPMVVTSLKMHPSSAFFCSLP